jgi:hypothetical protein
VRRHLFTTNSVWETATGDNYWKGLTLTQTAIVQTDLPDGEAAGKSLGRQISTALNAEPPDAVVLFASPAYKDSALISSLVAECKANLLVGCSSSGEFVDNRPLTSSACAVAIRSSDLGFGVGIARDFVNNQETAVREMVSTFRGIATSDFQYRSVLLLTDALAGHTEQLLGQLTIVTAGRYQIFGGGAGDDAKFSRTHVFYGTEMISDAAVGLEILSNKPLGIGVSHGWQPATSPMRVTAAEGKRLISLNAIPAAEVFEEHAGSKARQFDRAEPLPFFLHNILGIQTDAGFKLRVPLSVDSDGAIWCAAEIPLGSSVCIMSADSHSAADAADRATRAALGQMQADGPPAVALFFDCAATRLRMGNQFGAELDRVASELGPTRFLGCNTYGQIARVEGQFSGFHNCTAVVCIIPE